MAPDAISPRKYLGRYELVELLGKGGMGEVWLAKISGAAGFEKPCIVKTVLPELAGDQSFVDRFHHEAKVLVHLVHSNIAQVYDMGEADGAFFMALEYVPGVDLSGLLGEVRKSGQPLPLRIALYLAQKTAEGLAYAHRKAAPDGTPLSVVHRDVSPHNVMVSYEGEVKLIDFGLAKSAAKSKKTQQATVMGKLGYMSPEQVRALPLDARTDIYSCGVMLWEMLAGQPLVANGTVGEMMAAMAFPKVPSLRALRPEVSEALEAVVMRALAPEAAQRYARADELAMGLAERLMRSGAPVSAEEVGTYVRACCPEAFAAQQRIVSRLSTVNAPLKLDHNVAVLESTTISPVGSSPGPVPQYLRDTLPGGSAAEPVFPPKGGTFIAPPRAPAAAPAAGGALSGSAAGAPSARPVPAAEGTPTGSALPTQPATAAVSPGAAQQATIAAGAARAESVNQASPAGAPAPSASALPAPPASPAASAAPAPEAARQSSQLLPAELAAVRPSRGPLGLVLAVVGVLVLVVGGGGGAYLYLKRNASGAGAAADPNSVPGPSGAVAGTGSTPPGPSGAVAAADPRSAVAGTGSTPAGPSGAVAAADPNSVPGPSGAAAGTGSAPGGPSGAVAASGPTAPSGPTGAIARPPTWGPSAPVVGSPPAPSGPSGTATRPPPTWGPSAPIVVPPAPTGSSGTAARPHKSAGDPGAFTPLPFPDSNPKPKTPVVGRGSLKGSATFETTGRNPMVTIISSDSRTWHRCQVILPGRYVMPMVSLSPGFRRDLYFKNFVVDPAAADMQGVVQVNCAEGRATYPTPF